LQNESDTARRDTLQVLPCKLDGGIPPADGHGDPDPNPFGRIDKPCCGPCPRRVCEPCSAGPGRSRLSSPRAGFDSRRSVMHWACAGGAPRGSPCRSRHSSADRCRPGSYGESARYVGPPRSRRGPGPYPQRLQSVPSESPLDLVVQGVTETGQHRHAIRLVGQRIANDRGARSLTRRLHRDRQSARCPLRDC